MSYVFLHLGVFSRHGALVVLESRLRVREATDLAITQVVPIWCVFLAQKLREFGLL